MSCVMHHVRSSFRFSNICCNLTRKGVFRGVRLGQGYLPTTDISVFLRVLSTQVSSPTKMPNTLYASPDSPPCVSVMILAKVIGVDLQVKQTEYDQLNKEPFIKINPAHSIPALDDSGYRIWESRAIMGYLVQQYAKNDQLYPKDPKKRCKVDNMLHFDVGSLYVCVCEYFILPILFGNAISEQAKDRMKDRLSILNTILSEQPYVAGDSLSLADISIRCSLAVPTACGYGNYGEHSNVAKWIERFDREVPVSNDLTRNLLKALHDWCEESLKKFGLDPNIFH